MITPFLAMMVVLSASATPPDLTNGGVPGDTVTINLGPTGLRGWVYHVKADTSESRQIQVRSVSTGSPAAGILAGDDVILGADGSGADPAEFTADARKSLALAIADAEARDPAELKLLLWRENTTSIVTITLQTMGAYSATAPYNCPKSAKILEEGLQSIMSSESAGRYSFGTLSLLAANDPGDPDNAARMARAESEARALIPSAATIVQLMSDARDGTSMVTWQRGHTLIVLAEYYLATGDAQVLPAVEAYAVNIAKNQSLFGTVGHIFAEKNADGSDNGPMGGVYGTVNSAGMPCFLGLLLARECGLTHPGFQSTAEACVEAAIERSSRFFAYYAGKGAIPYGEHEPVQNGHENNGKSGLAALAFALQDNRADEGKFFAKMAAASASERESGHTGAFFNYLWAPLGAATGGEEAAASYFSRTSWHYDLARRWDGGFDYDCLTGEGPDSGSTYNNFRMSTAALLTYALPLRQLHLTGRGHDLTRWLGSTEVAEAEFADNYDADSRTTNELVADLGNWSPKVRTKAASELATRTTETTALLPTLNALATGSTGNARLGACQALGKIGHADSAVVLAALLTDPENHVRFMAADSMRSLSTSAKMSVLHTILAAAASTATPLLPLNEEDPLHFAHAKLAMLLFYSGSAYGPKGVIYNNVSGVDRDLLYPAIRAVAANPIGQARSTLKVLYQNLTEADVYALADTIVDSIHYRAPADKMFSHGVRLGGLITLQAHGIAEGAPLCPIYPEDDSRGSVIPDVLDVIGNYAGGVNTVTPDPEVISYLESLLGGNKAAQAQAVLDLIAADTNPTPLTPFKGIQSITADTPALTLPVNQTTLHVTSFDHAKGDSIYTWRKLAGTGNVTFSSNGDGDSKDTTITIEDKVPDSYLFEVTMSDSRGFTEVSRTFIVTLADENGTIPADDDPPMPGTMTWASPPQAVSDSAITMTATTAIDFSGVEYYFTCTAGGGHDSGWQDSPAYTDIGLSPGTRYTYTVTARDKSIAQNPTAPSAPASATTAAADGLAPTPDPMSFAVAPYALGNTSITMRATTASDPSGVEYHFTCTAGGGNDSGWQTSPTYTATDLSPGTQYTYTVMARDKSTAQNPTAPSAPVSATTLSVPGSSVSTLTAGTDVSFGDNAPRTLSVYPGKSGINAFTTVGTAAGDPVTIPFGTVIDYKLFQESATTPETIGSHASGGQRVSEVTSDDTSIANAAAMNGGIWTTTDPDVGTADIASPNSVNSHNGTITGTVDVSGLPAGTVYFIYGSFTKKACGMSATMSDTEGVAGDLTVSNFGGNLQYASDTEYLVTPLNFTNGAGYDTITYNLTHSSSGKFIGVVVSLPEPSANTPPTISAIDYQSLPSGGSTDALAFTVSDVETSAHSLGVTGFSDNPALVPDEGIVFGGSAGNRTVTVTPYSGLTGTAVITVTVDDGNETSDQTFLVTVTENYLSWATSHGVTGGPQGDSNHNGVPNLVEYALADGHERGILSGETLTFTKRGGDFGDDLSYVIETSIDLGVTDPWGPAEIGVAEDASSISYTFPSGNPVRQFARLKVVAVP